MSNRNFEGLSCGICYEGFDGATRRPRVLACGHTFCQSCLGMVLLQAPRCPACQTDIQFNRAESIPVNFSLESIIRLDVEHKEKRSFRFEYEGHCDEHDADKVLRCMDCKQWICSMCFFLHHKQCRALLADEAYVELKEQINKRLEEELEESEAVNESMEESLKVLSKTRKQLIEELKTIENAIKELKSQKVAENQFCEKLKQFKTVVESTQSYHECTKVEKEINCFYENGKMQILDLQSSAPLSFESLTRWCKDELVLTVNDDGDTSLHGRVTVKDGKFRISSFKSLRVIPFKELLSQITHTSEFPKTGFLRVMPTRTDCDEVDIVIETDGSSRGQNFALLCSALKGTSYIGLPIKWQENGYRYYLYPGPPPVVEGIKDEENYDMDFDSEEYYANYESGGGVYGMGEGKSFFEIVTRESDYETLPKFGVVVSGLRSLGRFWGEHRVTACGLVLSRDLPSPSVTNVIDGAVSNL